MTQASKKEKREAARQARLEAERKRRRARRRKQILTWTAVGVVVAVAAVYGVVRVQRSRASAEKAAQAAGCGEAQVFEELTSSPHVTRGQQHVAYNSIPPTSGPHYGETAPWGPADQTIEDELIVHNMEHGGVIVHYKGLSDQDVESLTKLVEAYPEGVISQPNPKIDKRIAIASWRHLQTCERFSAAAVEGFISRFCNKGPERLGLNCKKS